MTPAEFREALKRQGLTQGELGRLTHSSRSMVNRWYNGVHKVPGSVQAFLELREGRVPLGRVRKVAPGPSSGPQSTVNLRFRERK